MPTKFRRGPTVLALLIGTLITQIELNVVGTAMPDISAELHGFALYPWVFAGFLVASTATTPAFGMINDAIGRKLAYLASMGLVAIGSLVCGTARSMEVLVLGRLLQGCGSGGLFVTAQTLMGDLFAVEERARMQSFVWLASAAGSMTGPAVGGWIVMHTTWRWAFFVTLPVVAAATAFFVVGYEDATKRERKPVNWRGAALLSATLGALFVGISRGPFDPLLLSAAAGLGTAFFLLERRATRPILPPDLFANRAFRVAALTLFLIGAIQTADLAFLGLYLQGVGGVSPSSSGYIQAIPMTSVAIACAYFVGKLIKRYGYGPIVRIGAVFALLATLSLACAGWYGSVVLAIAGQACLGVCHGFATTAAIICVQNQVLQARRGTATASLTLARGIGSTLAPALLGVLFLMALGAQHLPLRPEQFLNQKMVAALPAGELAAAREALGVALRSLFPVMIGVGVLTLLASLRFPRAVTDVKE
jgi:MFS family permease